MARPRSDDKRKAILAAAVRVIAAEGLGAATATIAKEAGVSNGSLFTYFETKSDLFNQLYIEIKSEMADAAMSNLPPGKDVRKKSLHVWSQWLQWGAASTEKRKTLKHLSVSDDITTASHQIGGQAMSGIRELMELGRANGPMRDAPWGFVAALMSALAETTMDFMMQDPANADKHCITGFEAFWRMIA